MSTAITSAVLYAAKSTQDKHGSIPSQLEEARAMAEREGWRVVGEFKDEGFSAYSGNRGPGLEAAKRAAAEAAADSGQTCMFVAWRSDRFARGAGDSPGAANSLVEIWHEMRRQNVHLRTVRNDYAMHDPVLLAVEAKRIHEESKQKSADVKKGLERRRQAGKRNGARPFGTEFHDGELAPCEAKAPHVRRIFNEYVAGYPQQVISRNLNDDGVPSAKGGRWYQGTVRAILANPVYVELGIIDEATFAKAAKLRAKARKSHRGGRHSVGGHLFRKGMLRCGCGAPMITRTGPNRASDPYEVYICYERVQDKTRCAMPPLRRAELDEAVFRYFNEVGLDMEATKRHYQEAHERQIAEISAALADAKHEAGRADERLTRVKRDYQDGKLDADDWREQRAELTAECEAAVAVVGQVQTKLDKLGQVADQTDAEQEVLSRLAEVRKAIAGEVAGARDLEAVRVALKRLFESFTVSIPKDGRAEIAPKWRREVVTVYDDATGDEDWAFETKPARVPLDLAETSEAETLTT